jgi:DNA-binding GntR family transcriptional regulator
MQEHVTKTELALRALRAGISDGSLEPGRRLRVMELTEELGMSATPIREALRLLQADKLVEYRPHRGIVVASISSARIVEVFELRMELEPLATRIAVPRLNDSKVSELETLHKELKGAKPGQRSTELNAQWHWAVYNASGREYLSDFISRLWEVFPWRTIRLISGRPASSLQEHESVMQAIREHDASLAADRMRTHIESSLIGFQADTARSKAAAQDDASLPDPEPAPLLAK